jgi:hypothetical protein
MPTGAFEYRTEAERQAIERAIAFVAELHDLALAAPSGQVLDRCEQQATDRGRDLLRETLQQAVQSRIDAAEVKKGRRGDARAGAPSTRSGGAGGNS